MIGLIRMRAALYRRGTLARFTDGRSGATRQFCWCLEATLCKANTASWYRSTSYIVTAETDRRPCPRETTCASWLRRKGKCRTLLNRANFCAGLERVIVRPKRNSTNTLYAGANKGRGINGTQQTRRWQWSRLRCGRGVVLRCFQFGRGLKLSSGCSRVYAPVGCLQLCCAAADRVHSENRVLSDCSHRKSRYSYGSLHISKANINNLSRTPPGAGELRFGIPRTFLELA